jgi:hypothetical protein
MSFSKGVKLLERGAGLYFDCDMLPARISSTSRIHYILQSVCGECIAAISRHGRLMDSFEIGLFYACPHFNMLGYVRLLKIGSIIEYCIYVASI